MTRSRIDASGLPAAPRSVSGRLLLGLSILVPVVIGSTVAGGLSTKKPLVFAAEMARHGNWREALFRWEALILRDPDNPKILNNIAVAEEVLGQTEQAAAHYERAITLSGGDKDITRNRLRFRSSQRNTDTMQGATAAEPLAPKGPGKQKGKTIRVSVAIPVPPRLELDGRQSLLVASFLSFETELMDTNRELVRFLRSEFRKSTDLTVLDIVPPPAVPEQTLEDLLANHEFWQHLGRTYGADLIVSGAVVYDREDASAFRNVDVLSTTTGQKVRSTRFVEQERFRYRLDVFFMDGRTGELLFRDRFQRAVIFQGLQNDPFAAFYELSDSISDDVLAIVSRRTLEDTRVVFKK